MALHWNLEDQTPERKLAREALSGEDHGVLLEILVFGCLTVGLRGLTEQNVGEWVARHTMWSRVNGFTVVTREQVEPFIGLSVNVADESRVSWLMRVIEPSLNDLGGSRDVSEQDDQYMVTIGFDEDASGGPDERYVEEALRKGVRAWPEEPTMIQVEQVGQRSW